MIRFTSIVFALYYLFASQAFAGPLVSAQAYQGEPFVAKVSLSEADIRDGVSIRLAFRDEYAAFNTVYPRFLENALILPSRREKAVTIIRALKPANSNNFDLIICALLDSREDFYRFNVSVTGAGTVVSDPQILLSDEIKETQKTESSERRNNYRGQNSDTKKSQKNTLNSNQITNPPINTEPVSDSLTKIRELQSELEKLKKRSNDIEPKIKEAKNSEYVEKNPQKPSEESKINPDKPVISQVEKETEVLVQSLVPEGPRKLENYYSASSLRLEDIQSHTEIVILKLALAICGAVLFALALLTLYNCISRRLDKNDQLFALIKESSSEKTNRSNQPNVYAPPYQYPLPPSFNPFANLQAGNPYEFQPASGAYGGFGFSVNNPNVPSQYPSQVDQPLSSPSANQHVANNLPSQGRVGSTKSDEISGDGDNSSNGNPSNQNRGSAIPQAGLRTVSTRRRAGGVTQDAGLNSANATTNLRNQSPIQGDTESTDETKERQAQDQQPAMLSEDFQLAVVYQNMGDLGMARTVLHKIITEGSPEEKVLAQETLAQIDRKS